MTSNSFPPSVEPKVAKRRCIQVCQHRSCQRNHSEQVLAQLQAQAPSGVFVAPSDCMGQCSSGPTVKVSPDMTWYCQVKPEDVSDIVEEHLLGDRPVKRLLHPRFHPTFVIEAPSSDPSTQTHLSDKGDRSPAPHNTVHRPSEETQSD